MRWVNSNIFIHQHMKSKKMLTKLIMSLRKD
jgi:hypothetical protein